MKTNRIFGDIVTAAVPVALVAGGFAWLISGGCNKADATMPRHFTRPSYRNLESFVKPVDPSRIVLDNYDHTTNKQRFYLSNYSQADFDKAVECVFAEARGISDENYLKDVAATFYTRALESNRSITEVIEQNEQYSYLNKSDKNKVKAGNAREVAKKSASEIQAYKRVEKIVKNIFENGLTQDELLTHYFVEDIDSKDFPTWAEGVEVDKTYTHKSSEGGLGITRFLYMPKVEAALRGQVFSERI